MTTQPHDVGAAVDAALRRVTVWEPDLDPDERYVALADLDVDAVVAAVGRRLGGAPDRVGRSAALMGVASRLWSLTVVPAARDDVLPDPATFVVRDDDGAIVLGVRGRSGRADPSPDDVHAATLAVLEPLVERLRLADRLLWGNAAASLAAVPRVHDAPGALTLVTALLDRAPYAGELAVTPDGRARRTTCCLFYEVPGAGLCGDCVFDVPPGPTHRSPR